MGDGVGSGAGVGIALMEERMGQGESPEHHFPGKEPPQNVSRPWVLLGWDFPPRFEVEMLILAVGAPERGQGLGPVGAKVGGSTRVLDE